MPLPPDRPTSPESVSSLPFDIPVTAPSSPSNGRLVNSGSMDDDAEHEGTWKRLSSSFLPFRTMSPIRGKRQNDVPKNGISESMDSPKQRHSPPSPPTSLKSATSQNGLPSPPAESVAESGKSLKERYAINGDQLAQFERSQARMLAQQVELAKVRPKPSLEEFIQKQQKQRPRTPPPNPLATVGESSNEGRIRARPHAEFEVVVSSRSPQHRDFPSTSTNATPDSPPKTPKNRSPPASSFTPPTMGAASAGQPSPTNPPALQSSPARTTVSGQRKLAEPPSRSTLASKPSVGTIDSYDSPPPPPPSDSSSQPSTKSGSSRLSGSEEGSLFGHAERDALGTSARLVFTPMTSPSEVGSAVSHPSQAPSNGSTVSKSSSFRRPAKSLCDYPEDFARLMAKVRKSGDPVREDDALTIAKQRALEVLKRMAEANRQKEAEESARLQREVVSSKPTTTTDIPTPEASLHTHPRDVQAARSESEGGSQTTSDMKNGPSSDKKIVNGTTKSVDSTTPDNSPPVVSVPLDTSSRTADIIAYGNSLIRANLKLPALNHKPKRSPSLDLSEHERREEVAHKATACDSDQDVFYDAPCHSEKDVTGKSLAASQHREKSTVSEAEMQPVDAAIQHAIPGEDQSRRQVAARDAAEVLLNVSGVKPATGSRAIEEQLALAPAGDDSFALMQKIYEAARTDPPSDSIFDKFSKADVRGPFDHDREDEADGTLTPMPEREIAPKAETIFERHGAVGFSRDHPGHRPRPAFMTYAKALAPSRHAQRNMHAHGRSLSFDSSDDVEAIWTIHTGKSYVRSGRAEASSGVHLARQGGPDYQTFLTPMQSEATESLHSSSTVGNSARVSSKLRFVPTDEDYRGEPDQEESELTSLSTMASASRLAVKRGVAQLSTDGSAVPGTEPRRTRKSSLTAEALASLQPGSSISSAMSTDEWGKTVEEWRRSAVSAPPENSKGDQRNSQSVASSTPLGQGSLHVGDFGSAMSTGQNHPHGTASSRKAAKTMLGVATPSDGDRTPRPLTPQMPPRASSPWKWPTRRQRQDVHEGKSNLGVGDPLSTAARLHRDLDGQIPGGPLWPRGETRRRGNVELPGFSWPETKVATKEARKEARAKGESFDFGLPLEETHAALKRRRERERQHIEEERERLEQRYRSLAMPTGKHLASLMLSVGHLYAMSTVQPLHNVARRYFRQSIEYNDQASEPWLVGMAMLIRDGQYNDALDFIKGIPYTNFPPNPRADFLHMLGRIYGQCGDFQLAEQTYQAALDLEPDHALKVNLAFDLAALYRQGLSKPIDARRWLNHALSYFDSFSAGANGLVRNGQFSPPRRERIVQERDDVVKEIGDEPDPNDPYAQPSKKVSSQVDLESDAPDGDQTPKRRSSVEMVREYPSLSDGPLPSDVISNATTTAVSPPNSPEPRLAHLEKSMPASPPRKSARAGMSLMDIANWQPRRFTSPPTSPTLLQDVISIVPTETILLPAVDLPLSPEAKGGKAGSPSVRSTHRDKSDVPKSPKPLVVSDVDAVGAEAVPLFPSSPPKSGATTIIPPPVVLPDVSVIPDVHRAASPPSDNVLIRARSPTESSRSSRTATSKVERDKERRERRERRYSRPSITEESLKLLEKKLANTVHVKDVEVQASQPYRSMEVQTGESLFRVPIERPSRRRATTEHIPEAVEATYTAPVPAKSRPPVPPSSSGSSTTSHSSKRKIASRYLPTVVLALRRLKGASDAWLTDTDHVARSTRRLAELMNDVAGKMRADEEGEAPVPSADGDPPNIGVRKQGEAQRIDSLQTAVQELTSEMRDLPFRLSAAALMVSPNAARRAQAKKEDVENPVENVIKLLEKLKKRMEEDAIKEVQE